jgi:uncharacterized membrane protein
MTVPAPTASEQSGYRATPENRERFARRNLTAGALLGVGVAAFVDETVFHQLLHWHHFYDKSTPDAGLVSDGIFHAVGWFAAIGAMFLLADLYRRHGVWWTRWTAGLLIGAGVFQLYDGTIQHKLLGLHQIRYEVDLLPYDTVWNGVAVVLILTGLTLMLRTRVSATPRD